MPAPRIVALALVLVVCGCSGASDEGLRVPPTPSSSSGSGAAEVPSGEPPGGSPSPAEPGGDQPDFDPAAAMSQMEILASEIGPRQATSRAFREAATLVAGTFEEYGYQVRRQSFRVPAGTSSGVSVPGGSTQNIVAVPQGFDLDGPFRVVGAHLDTVPQAPGAEDNASGIAVVLELARMASTFAPDVPVVFVAFGAEEPRGPADDERQYGSQHLVASMTQAQRRLLLGMVALDGVGVRAPAVPVCSGGRGSPRVQDQLFEAADRAGVRVRRCEDRTSDHWPFEKAGLPAARVGGVAYDAFHSARDVPSVVSPSQLARTARLVWTWLDSPAPPGA